MADTMDTTATTAAADAATAATAATRLANAARFADLIRDTFPHVAYVVSNTDGGIPDPTALLADPALQTLMSGVNDAIGRLQDQVSELQTQSDVYLADLASLGVRLDEARRNQGGGNVAPGARNHRRTTKDPDPFSGEEDPPVKRQLLFRNWRSQQRRNWGVDHTCFDHPTIPKGQPGADFYILTHIPGQLTGTALTNNLAYFDTISDNPTDPSKWKWATATDCLDYFTSKYDTLDLALHASLAFDELTMGSMPFASFASDLQTYGELCEKSPEQLVSEMRLKITKELASQLTGSSPRPNNDDFQGWCALWQRLADHLEESKHFDKMRKIRNGGGGNDKAPKSGGNTKGNSGNGRSGNQNNQGQNNQNQAQPDLQGDHMDLSRMDLAPNECAYCHEIGHFRADCDVRPGSPNYNAGKAARVNATRGRGRGSSGRGRGQGRGGFGGNRGRSFGSSPGLQDTTWYPYQQQYQQQQPYYSTSRPQQNFNNQYGTSRLRQAEVPNPGFVYTIPDGSPGPSSPAPGPVHYSPGPAIYPAPAPFTDGSYAASTWDDVPGKE